MFNAKVVEDFLSTEDLDIVLDYAQSVENWNSGGDDFWKNRVLNMEEINNTNKKISIIFFNLLMKQKEYIMENYNLSKMLYSDTFALVRWFPGQEQNPHSDNMINTVDHIRHKHREYGSIIYLNNNFSGGETFYPQHNFTISPKPRMLAIHPADDNHMHGVSKVDNGIRYTIASFWTFDKQHSHECIVI